jgi:hypothetical protein
MSPTGPWTTPFFASWQNRDRSESLTSDVLAIRVGFFAGAGRPVTSGRRTSRAELLTVNWHETGERGRLTRTASDTVAPYLIVRERRRASRLPFGACAALTRAARSPESALMGATVDDASQLRRSAALLASWPDA